MEMLVKKIYYKMIYRGTKEADMLFRNYIASILSKLSEKELCEIDLLLDESDSFLVKNIFSDAYKNDHSNISNHPQYEMIVKLKKYYLDQLSNV